MSNATLGAPVTFTVAGEPKGKGRARSFVIKGTKRVGHYTPEATRSYEGMARFAAQEAMAGRPPLTCPVVIEIRAVFAVPRSWNAKQRDLAIVGILRPAKRPDLDNCVKAITDALNTVVYADDAQIVEANCAKRYGPAPMVIVTVRPA
jgi:Holliday junction resolvase RusA-like endonuclease